MFETGYRYTLQISLLLLIVFSGITTETAIKISRKRAIPAEYQEINTQNSSQHATKKTNKVAPRFNQSSLLTLKKHEPRLNEAMSNSIQTLQAFEVLLDNVINIMSQKISKMSPRQEQTTKTILQQATEIRSMLFSAREKLLQQKPDISEIRQFFTSIGMLLHLVAHFAHYLDQAITNKFKSSKPFDPMKTMDSIKKNDPAKAIIKNMYAIQDYMIHMEYELNNFDVTRINKIARAIDHYAITPFFKYHGDTIVWSVLGWGSLGSLLFWQYSGSYNNNKEFEYLKNQGLIESYQIKSPQRELPDGEQIFIGSGKRKGIYQKKQQGKTVEFTEEFKKTWNRFQRFSYWACNKIGFPSRYFSAPETLFDQQKLQWTIEKQNIFNDQKTALSTIDAGLTGILSNHYPLVTMATPMLWPSLQKTWGESIYPTIYGNVSAAWNKTLGGVYEKKTIEGNFFFVSNSTLDDVIGMEETKQQLEILIELLLNPMGFAQRHGNKINKAIAFTGPTRTGKTFLFEAFIGSLQRKLRMLGRPITSIQTLKIEVKWIKQVGITPFLDWIKSQAPAVIFIDEIDLLQLQRTGDTTILSEFLTGINKLFDEDPSKIVILFCATNKIENLDDALRTTGRLGSEIRFDYPSYKYRKEFIEREFKKLGLPLKNFDLDSLVQQFIGQPYEKVSQIIHTAITLSSIAGVPLTQTKLEEAIDHEIRKIVRGQKDLLDEESSILSAHFAGIITTFLLLKMYENLEKVTIEATYPNIKQTHVAADMFEKEEDKQKKIVFGGVFIGSYGDSEKLGSRDIIINKIKRLLSGFVAEEILIGSCGYTCHREYKNEAYQLVLGLLLGGIKFDSLPDAQKNEISKRAFDLIEQYTLELQRLFEENKKLLVFMSDALLKEKTLSKKHIDALYEEFKDTQTKKREEQLAQEQQEVQNTEEQEPITT